MKFVHPTTLFNRQNLGGTAKYVYVFTTYLKKKVKIVPLLAVKPGRAVDLQLSSIFNLGTRCMLSGLSDPPTNLHPGKELIPVPVQQEAR
jgi:hypothetical protein